MKYNKCLTLLLIIISISFVACIKPRVELNDTVWGDKAYITSAVLFKYTQVTNQLGYNEPVTGYQNTGVPTVSNVIVKDSAIIRIVAKRGEDITKIGIRFSHSAKTIEPINGAPPAGVISDFSKGSFVYRVSSADGTVRDWTLFISVAP